MGSPPQGMAVGGSVSPVSPPINARAYWAAIAGLGV